MLDCFLNHSWASEALLWIKIFWLIFHFSLFLCLIKMVHNGLFRKKNSFQNYLLERATERGREGGIEIEFIHRITKWLQQSGWDKAKARIQEFHLSHPHGWQGPKCLSNHRLPSWYISRKLNWKLSNRTQIRLCCEIKDSPVVEQPSVPQD